MAQRPLAVEVTIHPDPMWIEYLEPAPLGEYFVHIRRPEGVLICGYITNASLASVLFAEDN